MYLSMMLDFPTAWFPSKTILSFVFPEMVLMEWFIVIIFWIVKDIKTMSEIEFKLFFDENHSELNIMLFLYI